MDYTPFTLVENAEAEQDYDCLEARELQIEELRASGCTISYPRDDELFIDIDDSDQYTTFLSAIRTVQRYHEVVYDVTPSKGGLPRRHIRVTMPFSLTVESRIAWQAVLGSDPMRELISIIRASKDIPNPTIFAEKEVV